MALRRDVTFGSPLEISCSPSPGPDQMPSYPVLLLSNQLSSITTESSIVCMPHFLYPSESMVVICMDCSYLWGLDVRKPCLGFTGKSSGSNIFCLFDQEKDQIPNGTTLLGVMLSSDKTNISVMTRNRMAHLLLISITNIDADICSKGSLHAHVLLALLPIASFLHPKTHIRLVTIDNKPNTKKKTYKCGGNCAVWV